MNLHRFFDVDRCRFSKIFIDATSISQVFTCKLIGIGLDWPGMALIGLGWFRLIRLVFTRCSVFVGWFRLVSLYWAFFYQFRLVSDGFRSVQREEMQAAEMGYAEIVQLLLDRGADIKATNKKGRDALSSAAAPSMMKPTTESHRFVIRALVERGANLDGKDVCGFTAKDRAELEGRWEIVGT